MSELLRNQKFGVEVEFTGITRSMAAKAVQSVVGGSISGPRSDAYYTRIIRDDLGRKWKVMRDSSISPIRKSGHEAMDEYRVEFVTPPLHYSDLEILQAIIRKFKEIGGVPHSSCGIHIHIDGANHTADSLRRMVSFMYSRQDIIYEALGVEDRKYSWCKPICQELNTAMKSQRDPSKNDIEKIWYSDSNDDYYGGVNHEHYNQTRYHALNLHSFFSKGTVEFRLFNSTLHAGRMALSAWYIVSNGRTIFKSSS